MITTLTTDWFRNHYFGIDWATPREVGIQCFTRTPTFLPASETAFAGVTTIESLMARSEWVPIHSNSHPVRSEMVTPLYAYRFNTGSIQGLQLVNADLSSAGIDPPDPTGWMFTTNPPDVQVQEVVSAVAFYLVDPTGATYGGGINPVMFVSTQGIGTNTVIHQGTIFGQYTTVAVTGGNSRFLTVDAAAIPPDFTATHVLLLPALPNWEGAHAHHLWLEPQRTNFIANPSFEDSSLYGWRWADSSGESGSPGLETGWVELAPPPSPFENGGPVYTSIIGDGNILVGPGWGPGSGQTLDPFWVYDPVARTYTATATGPGVGYGNMSAGAYAQNNAYAFSSSAHGTLRYNSGLMPSWTPVTDRPGTGAESQAVSDSTYIYVLDNTYAWQRFDGGADTWATRAAVPVAGPHRLGAGLAYSSGKIYMFGDDGTVARTAAYNIVPNTWDNGTTLPGVPISRINTAVGATANKVWLVGGSPTITPGTESDTFYIFDTVAHTWTTGPPLPTKVFAAGGAVVGGEFYVFGVQGHAPFASVAYKYVP